MNEQRRHIISARVNSAQELYDELVELMRKEPYDDGSTSDTEDYDIILPPNIVNQINRVLENDEILQNFPSHNLFNYAVTFGLQDLVIQLIHKIDDQMLEIIGFYNIKELINIIADIKNDKNLGFWYGITPIVLSIINLVRDRYLVPINAVQEINWADKVWVNIDETASNDVANIRPFLNLDIFDPSYVISYMNDNNMIFLCCDSILSHAIVRKVKRSKDELCSYIVKGFNEEYMEELIQLLITDQIIIDFCNCSLVFLKHLSLLMLERHRDIAINFRMDSYDFFSLASPHSNQYRGIIAELFDLSINNNDNLNLLAIKIQNCIDLLIAGNWILPALDFALGSGQNFNFVSPFQYTNYTLGTKLPMKVLVRYSWTAPDEASNVVNLESMEGMMKAFVNNNSIEANYETGAMRYFEYLDQIYNLARGRQNAEILFRSGVTLLKWIAKERNPQIKRHY